jgi:hypothetical protein
VTTQHRQPPMAQRKVWTAYMDRIDLLLQLGLVRRGRANRVKEKAIHESRLLA